MTRSRTLPLAAAAVLSASLLTGCSDSSADEVRLPEPVLDFPQTSVTPTPTPTTTEAEETEETTEESTTTSTSTSSSSSSSSSSSTRTSTKTSTRKRSSSSGSGSGSSGSGNAAREPAPAAPAPARENSTADEPGAACAWPTQGARTGSEEYSTFCNREWARTVTSDGQDYYWVARGTGWVSVDPAGNQNGKVCWSRSEFEDAPEAIRSAVTLCEPAASTSAEAE